MQLTQAHVYLFRSLDDSDDVSINERVTVLVGQNESGKTAFLKALHKARPVQPNVAYDVITDYPRKWLNEYETRHATSPAAVAELTYVLDAGDIEEITEDLGWSLGDTMSVTVTHKYSGPSAILLNLDEAAYTKHLIATAPIGTELSDQLKDIRSLVELIEILGAADLNAEGTAFRDSVQEKFAKTGSGWQHLSYYVWTNFVSKQIPKFLYFDDYMLLPGKIDLVGLNQRNTSNPKTLDDDDRTVLALLRLAKVELKDLLTPGGFEKSTAKLEAIGNAMSDRIFEFWKQTEDLEVHFAVQTDSQDRAPFNAGNNLYIRIRHKRHRVTMPFDQRSRGFIWFFSFLVWFGSLKNDSESGMILLLDEPALSLHALAQADFLRYIDHLSETHQVLYTTHSPFMVDSDRLDRVRLVEDRPREGSRVTDDVTGSDPKTVFPLQAALGYTIAQNLFISKRNLLVEGPADLVYLKFFAAMNEESGGTALRDDVTIVPVGGLDKLSTFVALLGANQLEIAIVHDHSGKPDPHLQSLIRNKLIREKSVMNYAMFRGLSEPLPSTDVEDLFSPKLYLSMFNATYKKDLAGREVKESELPPGDRIVERLSRFLASESINLRRSGGFNHYLVASHLASNPPKKKDIDTETIARFDSLFKQVNALYSN